MKALPVWVLALVACCIVAGSDEQGRKSSAMPAEVRLTNGAAFKALAVVRFTSESVVVKHRGGVDPFQFRHMTPDSRAAWQEYAKDVAEERKLQEEREREARNAAHPFRGQVFIVTKGAGAYKLAGVTITVVGDQTDQTVQTVTDADGKFAFSWKGDSTFTLTASATRLAGSHRENFRWSIQRETIADADKVYLTQENDLLQEPPLQQR